MKRTQEEMRKELDRAYCAVAKHFGIDNWGEFARKLHIPEPTIYRYVNGQSNITENMLRRIFTEIALLGISIENSPVTASGGIVQNVSAPVNSPITNTTTDDKWFALVSEKDAQINRLLCIIEKMQQ